MHDKQPNEQVVVNLGNMKDIEKYYVEKADSVFASQKDKANAYNTIANYYIKDHDFNSALFYLGKTKGSREHDLLCAKIDIMTGKVDEALSLLKNFNPGNEPHIQEEYYNISGVLWSLSGKYDEAMDALFKAQQLSNNSLEIRNNIAFSYILQKKYDEASNILNAIIRSNPDYIQAKANLKLIDSLKSPEQ